MRVAIGSLLAVLLPGPLWGACVNSERNAGQFVGYDAIYVKAIGFSGSGLTALDGARGAWNDASCNTGVTDFPYLKPTPAGTGRTVEIELIEGFNPANENSCGRLVGNDILVYTLARNDTGSTVRPLRLANRPRS